MTDEIRPRVQTHPRGESRTKQSFRDECDSNTIMSRWQRGGEVSHLTSKPPQYGDYTNCDTYKAALDMVNEAEDSFAALPSKIRKRMAHSPVKLMEFMDDPANLDEAIELGLVPANNVPTTPPEGVTPADVPPETTPTA